MQYIICYCQSDSQSLTDLESTQSQNISNARTTCQYVHEMPIRSCLTDSHSILYSNSRTRCKYVSVFLLPVNALLIMLLMMYFTTYQVLLSTFLLSITLFQQNCPTDTIVPVGSSHIHCFGPINLYLTIIYNRIINNISLFPNSPKYPVSDHNISK